MFRANGGTATHDCYYRVMYGTYGGRPYAYLRVYTWECQSTLNKVSVRWTDGINTALRPLNTVTNYGGWDSCGQFMEMGGAGPYTAYGIGMVITLVRTNPDTTHSFNAPVPNKPDLGVPTDGTYYC